MSLVKICRLSFNHAVSIMNQIKTFSLGYQMTLPNLLNINQLRTLTIGIHSSYFLERLLLCILFIENLSFGMHDRDINESDFMKKSHGTFSVVPELYFQLYTIHATYLSHIVPVVYILLPGKHDLNLIPNFDPPNIMVDYERATINEIKKQFPNSNLSGCFFHLCQNVYHAVIRFGLKILYSENEDFSKQIRSLPALALLPVPDVIPTFDEIKAQFPAEEKEQSYVEGEIIQALAGVRKSRRIHQTRQETRILNIMNEPTITNFEKVMALAHIISLNKS
ncbi:unnamed protein product [Rotaria magnacalcarata]|uniref:MULE transposase domain-containing protein n=1 Tax=Rotaria magnacalcarata TaxID=392030 RepID=A0A818W0I5_9BILA|nr:unnamed protein product [Rotaria magnacalcarata]